MSGFGLPEITMTFPGGKRVDASFDGFTVPTDQPVKGGGDDSAPAPFMMFLASLGTCAGIFVLGFCQKRGLPTDGITLSQRHHMGPGPVPGSLRLARVEIHINIPPSFPEKYHDALVRVAEMCAVKQVIANPPEFAIRTVVTQ